MSYGSTSSAPTVLVTSSTSFIGAHTVLALISKGYLVKALVPRISLARDFLKLHPECAPSLEWGLLHNLMDARAVREAVREVDYVVHVCAPWTGLEGERDEQMDVLLPAVEGVHALLAACAREPRIKQVVLTSSFGAVLDPTAGFSKDKTYTPESWNPASWESALSATDPVELHLAAKTLAERSAWEFMRSHNPSFHLTTLCPPVILGPPAHPLPELSTRTLGESLGHAWSILSGEHDQVPPTRFPLWVDVRDLAILQVAALGNPDAEGKRFLAVGGEFTNDQLVSITAEHFPGEASRLPLPSASPIREGEKYAKVDMSLTLSTFGTSWKPRKLDDTVREMADSLYSRERELEREREMKAWWTLSSASVEGVEAGLELSHFERAVTVEVA